MSEPTTTGSGSGVDVDAGGAAQSSGEFRTPNGRSALVVTNRLAGTHLYTARQFLLSGEAEVGMALARLPDHQELIDAKSRAQAAHGLVWKVSRQLAAGELDELARDVPTRCPMCHQPWSRHTFDRFTQCVQDLAAEIQRFEGGFEGERP